MSRKHSRKSDEFLEYAERLITKRIEAYDQKVAKVSRVRLRQIKDEIVDERCYRQLDTTDQIDEDIRLLKESLLKMGIVL